MPKEINMCKGLFVIILFGFTSIDEAWAQPNLSTYFNDNSFSLLDLTDHQDIKFSWTIKGKLQASMNEGINEYLEGNSFRAISNFNAVIDSDSTFWPAFYYRGVCKKNSGDLTGASQDLIKSISLNSKIQETFLELGEIYHFQKQFSKAKKNYESALELAPSSAYPIYMLGTLALTQGDPRKAIKNYEKCNEIDHSFAPAYVTRGILSYRNNDKDIRKSLELLETAITLDSTLKTAYFWHGLYLVKDRQFEKGLSDWNRLIRLMPDNSLALQLRGFLFIELKRFDEAFADIKKAITLTTERKSIIAERTFLNERLDLQEAAIYISRKGYGLDEKIFDSLKKSYCLAVVGKSNEALSNLKNFTPNAPTYLLKSILFSQLKQPDSVLSNIDKALKIDNDIYDGHRTRAIYRYIRNDLKGANEDLMEMKRIAPEMNSTYRQSGMLKAVIKDNWGCIVDLAKFTKSDSSDAQVWLTRGDCRAGVKDFKGAIEDYEQGIKLIPDRKALYDQLFLYNLMNADTLRALYVLHKMNMKWPDYGLQMGMAELYIKYEKYDSASLIVDKVFALGPNQINPNLLVTARYFKGQILIANHNYEEGLRHVNRAIKLDPLNNEKIFYRMKILFQIGNTKDALSDLKTLKTRNFGGANYYYKKYLDQASN